MKNKAYIFSLRILLALLSGMTVISCAWADPTADPDAEEVATDTRVGPAAPVKINLDEVDSSGGALNQDKSEKAVLDEKRAKLREQLKKDRADSKRASSIKRNSELNKYGLDEKDLAKKKQMEYDRQHDEAVEELKKHQEASESAKQFSQWVNDNMMINKDKKKKSSSSKSSESTPASDGGEKPSDTADSPNLLE